METAAPPAAGVFRIARDPVEAAGMRGEGMDNARMVMPIGPRLVHVILFIRGLPGMDRRRSR